MNAFINMTVPSIKLMLVSVEMKQSVRFLLEHGEDLRVTDLDNG